MEFNVKKFVGDAGTLFNRAVQYTEEKLGNVEKTELDGHFEALAQKADMTKKWTEKLVANGKAVLVPNPGNRVEDMFMEKFSEKPRTQRLSNLEYLGIDMIDAGNEFGPGTAYGTALIKVGLCEQKLGQVERDFVYNAVQGYIHPLSKFLDGEMKTILKERKLLETKRLDLDACKRGLRKARSLEAQQNLKEGVNPRELIDQAERDLQVAQDEFDKQTEVTRLLLEGISSSHTNHLRHMNDFVETQARYYSQCYHLMQDLQRELASLPFNSINSELHNPVIRLGSEDIDLAAP